MKPFSINLALILASKRNDSKNYDKLLIV